MTTITIHVSNKTAVCQKRYLISSNSNYQIKFSFDGEWTLPEAKTARIIFDTRYCDIVFTGDTVTLPKIPVCDSLAVGVFTDTLATNAAELGCIVSAADFDGEAVTEFTHSQYDQIIALLNQTDLRQIAGIHRQDDNLIITYNNSTADSVPLKDGTGINGAAVDENGNLLLTLTDGSAVDCGRVRGDKGDKGDKGDTGETPQFSVGTVTTVEPDEPASATLSGTKENPVLNLTIPKGEKGTIEGIAVTTSKTVTVGKDSAVTLDSEIESQEVQLQWKIPGVRVVPPFTNYFLANTKFTYPRELTSGYNQFWSSSAAHGNASAYVSGHSYFWAFRFEMDGDSTVGMYNPGNKYVTPDGSTTLTGSGWAYQLATPASATATSFALNNLSGTGRIVYTYCIDITALQEAYSDVPSTASELAALFAELPLVPGQDFEGATTGGEDTVFLTVTRGEESFTLDCLTASATLQGGDVLQTSAGSVTFGISLTKIFRQEKRLTGKKWVAFGDSTTDPTINATKKYCDYIAEETGVTLINMGKGGTGYWRTNENGTAFYQRAQQIPADADVITCFGSINDWKYANSGLEIGTASDTLESGTICGYINEFINVCYEAAPYAQIALISMQPSTGINVTLMDNLNNAIKSVAAYRKIKFLDLWNESGLRTDDSVKAYYFTDPESEVMCHPSNEGHRLIYPDILQLLCRMIGSI